MVIDAYIRQPDLLEDEKVLSNAAQVGGDKRNEKHSEKLSIRTENYPWKSQSPKKQPPSPKRPATPKRVIVNLSTKDKSDALKFNIYDRCWEALNHDDDYYTDLQKFRKLYPELTSKRLPLRLIFC
jgi:hypothetical protein